MAEAGELSPELENLAIFYRTMSTQLLRDQRTALMDMLQAARASRGKRGKLSADYCVSRLQVIRRVLGERGILVEDVS